MIYYATYPGTLLFSVTASIKHTQTEEEEEEEEGMNEKVGKIGSKRGYYLIIHALPTTQGAKRG